MSFGFKTIFLMVGVVCCLSACSTSETLDEIQVVAPTLSANEYFLQGAHFFEEDNFKQAAILLRRAADLGHFKSQFLLGILYERGNGVIQSYEQAEYWMQKSANQGYRKGAANLRRLRKKMKQDENP